MKKMAFYIVNLCLSVFFLFLLLNAQHITSQTWVGGVFECNNFISVSQSGWISHLYFWSLLYWAINIKGTMFHLA